jgi:hypothetical protein
MSRACSAHRKDEKTLKGTDHLGDIGVDRRIILKWILNKLV